MSNTNDAVPVYIEVDGRVYQAYTRRDGHFDCDRCDRHRDVIVDGCKLLARAGIRHVCSGNKWIWKEVKGE